MPRVIRLWICFLVLGLHAGLIFAGDKSGGWRLADVSSPYLRMHADNPVNWYSWGPEAWEQAKRQNKPLFVSIGYFTCHWCHVMERESFRNPEIADLLNQHFISIKIDREQRPDIDAAFMRFVVATRGRGGWPMSVWATPDGKPFLGGTYFPDETRGGQPGMKQLLPKIASLWEKEPETIYATGARVVERLSEVARPAAKGNLPTDSIATALSNLTADYDEFNGGFSQAPKFPEAVKLIFVGSQPDADTRAMALHTLDKMAAGGIHDQLGGGFHRYSIDTEWHVPHFEKMLYDQALITRAYLTAFSYTQEQRYADVARRSIDFVLREMRASNGGFFSALGADSPVSNKDLSHQREGAYYTWSWEQLVAALPDQSQRRWAVARYGIRSEGNTQAHGDDELAGQSVLYAAATTQQLASTFEIEPTQAMTRSWRVERALLKARAQRPAVPVDDKIITEWNAYMITTLAIGAEVLSEPKLLQEALVTAEFIVRKLYDDKTQRLYRDWSDGASAPRGVAGFSQDYAALTEAFLTLYAVTTDTQWLRLARQLTEVQIEQFWDEVQGGFYASGEDSALWFRDKRAIDGSRPSANSISIGNLLQLAAIDSREDYLDKAVATATWGSSMMPGSPQARPYALLSWRSLMDAVKEKIPSP
ncbi:MAG TPA: thioredoxin domain-containing protein [Chromatiales bacterium]|nr:thioredoxin domain-containing protein [Chromatiaceae bacterium]HIO55248.1 thioredoxin domain-containing protein [Chromatiales bacterium]